MFKRFIDWIQSKTAIDAKERKINSIKEGEVYWCALGENVGDEENGKGEIFRRPSWYSKNLTIIYFRESQ